MYSNKYVPQSLKNEDRKKQIQSIKNKTIRPKLDSFKSKRSSWVEKFEDKFGYKITNKKVYKDIITKKGAMEILNKGKGAYFSSGSRPNQTPYSWAYSRLASVIMNGPARKIDIDIWNKYKI